MSAAGADMNDPIRAAQDVPLPTYVYGRETAADERLVPLSDVGLYRDAVLAALRAALPGLREVPAGWKLVPVEPTAAMVAKALKECDGIGAGSCGERVSVDGDDMRSVYEAMLAAAPSAAGLREAGEPVAPGFHDCSFTMNADALHVVTPVYAAPPSCAPQGEPIDMILHCPNCGMQHIDAPEPRILPSGDFGGDDSWTNPPHRSHKCHGCGHIWRPADVPTNGVAEIKTKGKDDSPVVQPAHIVRAIERMHGTAAPQAERALGEVVALPKHETPEMHDAVMSLLYRGVARTETDLLWQAYRKALLAAPQTTEPAPEAGVADPCPACRPGIVCRTPKCGRLKQRAALAATKA